jgi:prepilin-type N-terminal cleavage/methylation domain-containing protein
MKLRSKTLRKGFTLIELLVVIAILGALAGVSYGIFSFLNSGAKQAAAENMGQIATALNGFKEKNASRFPGDDTARTYEDKKYEQYALFKGEYSNDYFRQLFACPQSRKSLDESQFFADIPGVTEGDGDTSQGECLKTGENAFAYVMKYDKKKNMNIGVPSSAKNCPLLFCCVKADEGVVDAPDLLIDLAAFDNYAIMYTTNRKVVPLEVDDGLETVDESVGKLSEDPFPKNAKDKTSYIGDYKVIPPAL